MMKKSIGRLAKQLTAHILSAVMVLCPMGGGIQSIAASQDSAAETAAENDDEQSEQKAKTESKTEQKSDNEQDSKNSQQTAEVNINDDTIKNNGENNNDSPVKDTANENASGKTDSESDVSDANSKSENKWSDEEKNADVEKDAGKDIEKEAKLSEDFSVSDPESLSFYAMNLVGISFEDTSEGQWVEVDGKYKYKYTTGEYAKDKLIVTEGDDGTARYYVDKNGYRVTNMFVAVAADEEACDSYGIHAWWYYFGEDGIAYHDSYGRTINWKTYGFDSDGHMLYGFVKRDSFDLQNVNEVNAFRDADYFYGKASDYGNKAPEANVMLTGWLVYTLEDDYGEYGAGDSVWLYFDSKTGLKLANTTSVIGGVSYTFDEYGVSDKRSEVKPRIVFDKDDIASVTYTGNAQKPHVTVKQGDEVVDASQYKVSYANNVDAGTATVTAEFTDTGYKLSRTFVITGAKPTIEADDVTITYDGFSHAASGKASIPNGIDLADDKLKIKYYTDADCTKGETETAPKTVGIYYAKLYVDSTSNYEYAEKIVRITIKTRSSSGGLSSGGSSSGGGTSNSGISVIKLGAGSAATLVPTNGVAGTWKKNTLGRWTFTSNDKHEYSYEWAYIANPNADTSKGQEAALWFRFDADGTMLTGWYKNVYGDWYYLNPVSDSTMGAMLKGWQYINGYWYYLEEKEAVNLGHLYVSKQTPDGKTVDAEGHWVKNGVAVTDADTKPTA